MRGKLTVLMITAFVDMLGLAMVIPLLPFYAPSSSGSTRHRGLYMGVQHTFGGVSRVMFPLAAGVAMDHLGIGFPFVIAGVLVLATLLLTTSMEEYAPSRAASVT
jgi:MFS family permease